MSFEPSTTESHERRITRCKSCRAQIIWFRTASGKSMPVNADTVEPEDDEYEHGRHISHFSTCPDQARWRRAR